ncbi:MAG: hypothetical protein ACNS60_17330 [Candidatus Cyclobacteriaceae bacterium M2_1C_046]
MELDKDFKEFVELLNANEVEYLVVGGYSVAHHGYPRFTGDFDVWVKPELNNGRKMMNVLDDFGFGAMGITAEDLTSLDKEIQFGVEPVKIDVMTGIDGIPDFDSAFKSRDISQYGDLNINFISYNDLIINKKTTNRLQDKLDVEQLSKVNKKNKDKGKGLSG